MRLSFNTLLVIWTSTLLVVRVESFSTTSFQRKQSNVAALFAKPKSQLEQLSEMTTLSIDSGDLKVIEEYASTGYITDATTNPLFVSQAGLSKSNSDPIYAQMVDNAVQYAITTSTSSEDEMTTLAMDRLAVNLGYEISKLVPGYISTEVDPRLSFNTKASIQRGRDIINMYEKDMGVSRDRILIKLAATWEGIKAAEQLEKEGIQCNLTLIFSFVQAVACAQCGVHLISPFPGRVLDWYNRDQQRNNGGVSSPDEDEGVIVVRKMYNYYKCHNHDTICMPASWRPSRGKGYELDEILALAGTDRMTIPAPLLEKLATSQEPIERQLTIERAKQTNNEPSLDILDEEKFRYLLNMDGCGTDKLAEGIRAFIGETEKLEFVMKQKVKEALLINQKEEK